MTFILSLEMMNIKEVVDEAKFKHGKILRNRIDEHTTKKKEQ